MDKVPNSISLLKVMCFQNERNLCGVGPYNSVDWIRNWVLSNPYRLVGSVSVF